VKRLEAKTRNKVKYALAIVLIWLSFSLTATNWPPEALADYGHRERTDGWGDAIQIVSNYNIRGGHVDFKAVASKSGIRLSTYGIGYTLGTSRARITKFYIYVKCYNAKGQVIKYYRKTYYPKRGSYRKSVRVPRGTVRIKSKIKVRFQLLMVRFNLPTKNLGLSLYS